MKKVIITVILNLVFFSNIKAQNDDKIYYDAKDMKFIYKRPDDSRDEQPIGKNVRIIYDKFFKKYTITYFDIDGKKVGFDMNYSTTGKDGRIFYYSNDKEDELFYLVTDYLESKHLLIFMKDEYLKGGVIGYMAIEEVVQGEKLK